jgi:hypothetical protein
MIGAARRCHLADARRNTTYLFAGDSPAMLKAMPIPM